MHELCEMLRIVLFFRLGHMVTVVPLYATFGLELSHHMTMAAEGVDILSTDGLQVELHTSRRCTSATSRIPPRTTNPYKPKGGD
jgi:hypothetical protein